MKVVYIAGPFRGETSWEVAENVRAAERVGLEVARLGYMPLTPHANTAHFDGCLPDAFWLEGTLELLRRCDAVVLVPGWERSRGTKAEIREAEARKIPVFQSPADITFPETPEVQSGEKLRRWLTADDARLSGTWRWYSRYWPDQEGVAPEDLYSDFPSSDVRIEEDGSVVILDGDETWTSKDFAKEDDGLIVFLPEVVLPCQ